MRAKFELSEGPTNPATLAVQFLSEGSTLSGVEIELVGSGYRLSLTKKRFATGRKLVIFDPYELLYLHGMQSVLHVSKKASIKKLNQLIFLYL